MKVFIPIFVDRGTLVTAEVEPEGQCNGDLLTKETQILSIFVHTQHQIVLFYKEE